MSVADRSHLRGWARASTSIRHQHPARQRRLAGWGRASFSRADVITAGSIAEVGALLSDPGAAQRGVLARGAGRSYGDAAQSTAGVVIDTTALTDVLEIDTERRLARVQAGVTYAALLGALASHGFTLPVIPGTRHVTIGGAIAGIGGAALAFDQHQFQSGMSGGRGFIALAAVIVSGRRPGRAVLACTAFALLDASQIIFQGKSRASHDLVTALPYIATLLSLTVLGRRQRSTVSV